MGTYKKREREKSSYAIAQAIEISEIIVFIVLHRIRVHVIQLTVGISGG